MKITEDVSIKKTYGTLTTKRNINPACNEEQIYNHPQLQQNNLVKGEKETVHRNIKKQPHTTDKFPLTLREAYTVIILLCVYILNQADRQLLPILISAGLKCTNETVHEHHRFQHKNATDCLEFSDMMEGLIKVMMQNIRMVDSSRFNH